MCVLWRGMCVHANHSSNMQLSLPTITAASIYVVGRVFQSVQHDIDVKVHEYSQDIMGEIAACAKHYQVGSTSVNQSLLTCRCKQTLTHALLISSFLTFAGEPLLAGDGHSCHAQDIQHVNHCSLAVATNTLPLFLTTGEPLLAGDGHSCNAQDVQYVGGVHGQVRREAVVCVILNMCCVCYRVCVLWMYVM
jgi:hypothetical protein